MGTFTPRNRTDIYAESAASILANAPVTSSELGTVVDNVTFAFSDQIYECYVQMSNILTLKNLDTVVGEDLDKVGAEYPDLEPRKKATRATTNLTVSDPNIVKKSALVATGGAFAGDLVLNVDSTSDLPDSGEVLVGKRGDITFEKVAYSSKTSSSLNLSSPIANDHGSGEAVVVSTVGDRVFSGTYQAKAISDTGTSKTYTNTSPLTIYDGEKTGILPVQADSIGPDGNTDTGTITAWVGTPPFSLAEVINENDVSNAISYENDPDYRARIRQQRQALSTANIDAILSSVLKANNNGQVAKFTQDDEDVDPTTPTIIYVDDGSGFTPETLDYGQEIVLVDSAVGGERKFEIPELRRPLVVTDEENISRVFSSIEIKKNGVLVPQGDLANQCRVQPDRGIIRINTQLNAGDTLVISRVKHYTGLIQEVSWQIYGRKSDRINYKGSAALGAWIQVRAPSVQFVSIVGSITLDGTVVLSEVVSNIKNRWLTYVNGLGIGNSVVKNKLLALAFVAGVRDFTLSQPSVDIVIGTGTLAKLNVGNIELS